MSDDQPGRRKNGQERGTNPKPSSKISSVYWHSIVACGRAREEMDLGKRAGRCFCESLCVPTAYVCGIVKYSDMQQHCVPDRIQPYISPNLRNLYSIMSFSEVPFFPYLTKEA